MDTSQYMLSLFLSVFLINGACAMRCGNHLVLEGDNQFDVQKKCGDPLAKEQYEESVPLYNGAGYQVGVSTIMIEKWIYQKSSADFEYDLIFNNGVVQEINTNRNP